MIRRNLLLIAAAFCAGILISGYLTLSVEGCLLLAIIVLLINAVFFLPRGRAVTAVILACALLAGAFWYGLSRYPEKAYGNLSGQTAEGKGIIITYPKAGTNSLSFLVKVENLSAGGKKLTGLEKLLIRVKTGEEKRYLPGTRVFYRGDLAYPFEPRNPGDFDYREYLANQRVFYQLNLSQENLVVEEGKGIRNLAALGREKVSVYLRRNLPERESGLLLGLLFGDVSGISESDWEAYQRAGVLHLFAVSGFNVALVLGVAYFLLSFFSTSPFRRLLWSIPVLTGYYFLVGWTASIVRASFMALIGLMALLFSRKQDVYTSMALAALMILLVNPGELFQVSFQLSFAATAGIVYLSPYLKSRGFGGVLAPALAAQAVALPLIAYYFNLISLVAPLLNVLAVIVSGFVTVLGVIGSLFIWIIPLFAAPVFLTAGVLLFILSEIIIRVAVCDWAAVTVASPSLPVIILFYILLLLLPHLSRLLPLFRYLPARIKSIAVIVLITMLFVFCWDSPDKLEVIFLDVGQGDSIFIETPGGNTMLVDGGGTPNSTYQVGQKTVRPFLQHRGLDRIDVMVMSHNHLDHSEGLLELISLVQVGCFLMPQQEENNLVETEICSLCGIRNIPVRELAAGQHIILDEDVYMEVLHPASGDDSTGNNHSLVLRLIYLDTKWLLTGDIEEPAIKELLRGGADLQADVLKLPHHGSITSFSPEFYQAVNPREVVVSAGVNMFGQPHPDVLGYFREQKIPLHLTRETGAVITKSDGRQIEIRTMH